MLAYQRPTPATAGPAAGGLAPRGPDAAVGSSNQDALAACAGEGEARATFDTGTHVGIGDAVDGASIVVKGVPFTPGEAAALVDFVGNLKNLWDFSPEQLVEMKQYVRNGVEDAALWDAVTNGAYTKLAVDNSDHFGPQIRTSFVDAYGRALELAILAQAGEDGDDGAATDTMNEARMYAYTAEHFLEDAFSAGHQVDPDAITDRVAAVWEFGEAPWILIPATREVYNRNVDLIHEYEMVASPFVITELVFVGLTSAYGAWEGVEGVSAGIRKYIHEQLAAQRVEVSSEAHREPWLLEGDHTLDQDPVSQACLKAALTDARTRLELAVPGVDPYAEAAALFAYHAPKPTVGGGALVVERTLDEATHSPMALAHALADGVSSTIREVMDGLVTKSHGAVRRKTTPDPNDSGRPIPDFGQGVDDGTCRGEPARDRWPGAPSIPSLA